MTDFLGCYLGDIGSWYAVIRWSIKYNPEIPTYTHIEESWS